MPRFDESSDAQTDQQPNRPNGHDVRLEIMAIQAMSIEEIDERIAALRCDIARLEAERSTKEASRHAADAVFKR